VSWGAGRLALPFVRGTGTFEVLFASPRMRVFRSPLLGSLSVQVPDGPTGPRS